MEVCPRRMKHGPCGNRVHKLKSVPEENGVTLTGCNVCVDPVIKYLGYSPSFVAEYTKKARLNKDIEEEIRKSDLTREDFEPYYELWENDPPFQCPECKYFWPSLKPFQVHDKKKCPKRHCSGCGGHIE